MKQNTQNSGLRGRRLRGTAMMKTAMVIFLGLLLSAPCFADGFRYEDVPPYSGQAWADVNDSVPFFAEGDLVASAFEEYGALDSLGRCTYAYACVGPETMPDEPREDISEIRPTGWVQAKYGEEFLYNRCHLIGFQLTEENANERNLITGTRYMNVDGMLENENSVASYIRETGNHVLYRVTPVFEGDNLLAAGVLMEAKSVEDPAVEYCQFCYNVQPGVVINYATGESRAENTEGAEAPGEEKEYVLNKNSMKFHLRSCESVGKISAKNREDRTARREDLVSEGYVPCKACNP